MNEIKCPKCNTIFQINETDYNSIVKQIRDKEFEKEIEIRNHEHKIDKENALKIVETDLENKRLEEINSIEKKYQNTINENKIEIEKLKNELKVIDSENKLNLQNELIKKDKEISDLTSKLEIEKNSYLLKEKNIKESYEDKLKSKDEQILYYKDFKAKQSTKMIGESLEVHCNDEFNKLRPLFKNAYFEKDNDAKTGSKGDFIFRDFDDDGLEITSIMFEMKNEADETSIKHKNEDFFKELDKDRKEKNCEYAVLVSLLEMDSDYYNSGIVDVSHKYEKMYVIRPQFFIPLITLIRNASIKSLDYKKELTIIQNQNIDISNFEDNMNKFKESFGKNYRLASEKFNKAIEEIDKTIDHLQKTKEALLSSENNLRIANNKAEDLSIKRLTNNSETVRKMFDDLKSK
jgi:hypothetical protein